LLSIPFACPAGMKKSYSIIARKEPPLSHIEKRTISLPEEHAAYIDGLVESGQYASASEVVRAGLRALQERDRAVERWLREEVAPVYDAMQADPSRALSVEAVSGRIRAHHAARLKTAK